MTTDVHNQAAFGVGGKCKACFASKHPRKASFALPHQFNRIRLGPAILIMALGAGWVRRGWGNPPALKRHALGVP